MDAQAATPSARIIAAAQAAQTVTDAQGRRIELRQLTALDKLRLFKAVGPMLAQNQPYLGLAVLACSVTAIDGIPVPAPVNEAQIESMVARLGDAGLAAIGGALRAEPGLDAEAVANAGN